MPIPENIQAPNFALQNEKGAQVKLSDYLGKWVVLYFYPKDDTPGCTTEACGFRDNYSAYTDAGAVILGVSPDSGKSHTKFIDKFQLPFTLLSDTDHEVCLSYGVWGRKKFMGREYDGVFRTTFVINPAGIVVKVFENVKPDGHSTQVLDAILS